VPDIELQPELAPAEAPLYAPQVIANPPTSGNWLRTAGGAYVPADAATASNVGLPWPADVSAPATEPE
jgi:hypothetical protein